MKPSITHSKCFRTRIYLLILGSLILVACGGGGGSTKTTPPSTEAVWDTSNWDENNWQ